MANAFADTIVGLVSDMVLSRYLIGAGLTIMVYDWLLTLSSEIKYIWQARWTSVKVVFLINRYFMPLTLVWGIYGWSGQAHWLTERACELWITIDAFILLGFFATLHWIVAMRAWALWGRTRTMGILIWGSFLIYIGVTGYLTGKAMHVLVAVPIPGVDVCFGEIPTFLWTVWLPSLVFETFIFGLTAVKAVQHQQRNVDTPILSILYRDGFLYFIFICINSFVNLLVWAIAPPTSAIIAKYISAGVSAVAGSHLIIDLIEVGHLCGATNRSVVSSTPPKLPLSPSTPGTAGHAAGGAGGVRTKTHNGDVFEMMPSVGSIQFRKREDESFQAGSKFLEDDCETHDTMYGYDYDAFPTSESGKGGEKFGDWKPPMEWGRTDIESPPPHKQIHVDPPRTIAVAYTHPNTPPQPPPPPPGIGLPPAPTSPSAPMIGPGSARYRQRIQVSPTISHSNSFSNSFTASVSQASSQIGMGAATSSRSSGSASTSSVGGTTLASPSNYNPHTLLDDPYLLPFASTSSPISPTSQIPQRSPLSSIPLSAAGSTTSYYLPPASPKADPNPHPQRQAYHQIRPAPLRTGSTSGSMTSVAVSSPLASSRPAAATAAEETEPSLSSSLRRDPRTSTSRSRSGSTSRKGFAV